MAISPEEAGSLSLIDQHEVRDLEKTLDKHLKEKEFDYANRIIWRPKYPVSYKVAEAVCKLYEDAGWRVAIKSDQRDGTWWEFTVA